MRVRLSSLLALVAALVGVTLPANAEDAAVVAATLRGQATECRYLLELCRRHDVAAKIHDDKRTATNAARELYEQTLRKKKVGDPGLLNAWSKALDESTAAGRAADMTLDDARRAAAVIRAKHDTQPECFNACAGL